MTHAAYVPNYVPSYCENMRLVPPEYYHDLEWNRDDAKVTGLIRTSNPGFGEIEGSRKDYRKQLVWVCKGCYGETRDRNDMGTLIQLFDPTWEPDWNNPEA